MGTPGSGRRQPNEFVRRLARTYNAAYGLGEIQQGLWLAVDEARARRIANAYEALPIDGSADKTTRTAYEHLAREIEQQWNCAVECMGIAFEPWTCEGQPYANSAEMCRDVREHLHLFFYQGGDPHPLLGKTDPATGLSLNDKFRAIHDLFGHAAEGYGFGPRGEENAWIRHSQMFSSTAQKAMTTETRGQNSWVNFGRHNYDSRGNHTNRPLSDRPYAIQKAALLPDEFADFVSVMSKLRS
jgi:hypothetical protein